MLDLDRVKPNFDYPELSHRLNTVLGRELILYLREKRISLLPVWGEVWKELGQLTM